MLSSAALARCALVVPRVSPIRVPLAYESQCGAPRPTSAGTKYTSSLESRLAASSSVSWALSMMPRPSLSYCTAAPVMKMAPSSAYSTGSSPRPQAMVVRRSFLLFMDSVPVFMRAKEPVP